MEDERRIRNPAVPRLQPQRFAQLHRVVQTGVRSYRQTPGLHERRGALGTHSAKRRGVRPTPPGRGPVVRQRFQHGRQALGGGASPHRQAVNARHSRQDRILIRFRKPGAPRAARRLRQRVRGSGCADRKQRNPCSCPSCGRTPKLCEIRPSEFELWRVNKSWRWPRRRYGVRIADQGGD